MNHSIHSALAANANQQQQQQQQSAGKQTPMHLQLHYTLGNQHHPLPLPLVNNSNQQNMLHFQQQQQQTLHHPYSTLHHHHQQQQQQPQVNQSLSHHFSQQNLPHQHLSQQQQQHHHTIQSASQQQQQQQAQYNMNSDYSSSTYHIYDQISDLMIIKQQRMERKRQKEHRRKVILLALAAILLVATLVFLLIQSLFPSTASSPTSSLQMQPDRQDLPPFVNQNAPGFFDVPNNPFARAPWAPSVGPNQALPPPFVMGPVRLPSDKEQQQLQLQFQQQQQIQLQLKQKQQQEQQYEFQQQELLRQQEQRDQQQQQDRAIAAVTAEFLCSGHGTVISQQQATTTGVIDLSYVGSQVVVNMCKCDPGFWGEHCESSSASSQSAAQDATYQQANKLPSIPILSVNNPTQQQQQQSSPTAKELNDKLRAHCLLTNCTGNGQCDSFGRCHCFAGFLGVKCEQQLERQCDDGIDNDKDGLVDCADSECCSDKACQNSTLCTKSPDPVDILLRKQPTPPTASFFQRMQFLIEKSSSQIYSTPKDFNDSILMSRYFDRASVIRGRVTYMKQGVTGVRVSVAGQANLGITFSRDGGYFDLLVNGGGAVIIELRREPFATLLKAIRVPWNEIVLVEQVELQLDSTTSDLAQTSTETMTGERLNPLPEAESPTCSAHDYRLMRPHIVAAPRSSRRSHSSRRSVKSLPFNQAHLTSSKAVILRESGMVQQSISLPGSSSHDEMSSDSNQTVSLIYISSRANEFMSTIHLQLTPPISTEQTIGQFKLPDELKIIHLKIAIEGNLTEQLFVPQMNLSYTFAWNRRNVYRQKSFGLSTATVSVGYEYFDCKHIIWSTRHIQLPGHDLSISDIGNQWNLNIHHRYNYRDSILQRGDGQNFNLKTDKPRIVLPILGNTFQQSSTCIHCDSSNNNEQRLLKPQALVSAPDGSLYLGDYNLIRKIEYTGAASGKQQLGNGGLNVRTILELPTSRVPSKYSLALNLENHLYMSDNDRHQIYLIREQNSKSFEASLNSPYYSSGNETNGSPLYPSEENLIPIVGNGIKCQPEDQTNCGDGQAARLARLIEPKALAFDLSNRLYIADGPNVRMVNTDGKIYTILGDYNTPRSQSSSKFPCSGEAIPMHKFLPKAPIDLAINPIDDTLHVLDENVVYKITQDKRVQIVAGRLSHCPAPPPAADYTLTSGSSPSSSNKNGSNNSKQLRATEVFLQHTQSITFNHNGELFISEDDQRQQISRVLFVSPEEDTITLYAGLPLENAFVGRSATGGNYPSSSSSGTHQLFIAPTVDSLHLDLDTENSATLEKQRSSNVLPISQNGNRATEHKFSSVAAIAVDPRGKLIVADKIQLRIQSIEPDLPQINAAGEYELQSPDNGDELLVFNRYGHHVATREISSGQAQRNVAKYTFIYTVNTSFGLLASVNYASGNKISIYRDSPHHTVRMIETAFGGQCKLDITRNGQVQSISTIAPNTTKTNFSYHIDGGLLKQSRDQASGELFDFSYDENGRAVGIKHTSPRLPVPLDCRTYSRNLNPFCSALIVAD